MHHLLPTWTSLPNRGMQPSTVRAPAAPSALAGSSLQLLLCWAPNGHPDSVLPEPALGFSVASRRVPFCRGKPELGPTALRHSALMPVLPKGRCEEL